MEGKANFYKEINSGLENKTLERIRDVFSKYHQIDSVLLYGSRAMGNYKNYSDIDLTLIGENIDLSLKTEIAFELDDLMLPYKFDLSIYHKIANREFIEHIDRVGKPLYLKAN